MSLQTFKKGIHPNEYKELSEHKALERMPVPKQVFIPMQQHIGSPCQPTVAKKDIVQAGQLIGKSTGFVSSTVHASISGKVKAVDTFAHPLGVPGQMVHIVGDDEDSWVEPETEKEDWEQLEPARIIERIQDAGIVGMGGAAFPTHVKLHPPKGVKIDTLVINGCECEPYLTADHRMMLEQTDEMILGTRILMRALGVERAVIGIESNKADAIQLVRESTARFSNIDIVPLKVKYPQGAEKMLIRAALRREVPPGKLPLDVGVVVNNVGTAIAVADALTRNLPLIERVVTVTGDGIREPKNVIARIGTPFQDLIDFCGGLVDDTVKVLMGGPMMGVAQADLKVPVIKATSGILCLSERSVTALHQFPCIQCGNCLHACPMGLIPTRIARLAEIENYEDAERFGILNCIECGSCAFVCPSRIPLVHWMRVGKLRVNEINRKKKAEEIG